MIDLFGPKCPCCGQTMPEKSTQSLSFSAFWETTNKRGSRLNAEKAWSKLTSSEKQIAADKVRPFAAYFAKEYPGASPMHISTYLNKKHFLQEGIRGVEVLSPDQDPAIGAIKSGKRHLCRSVSAARARQLIASGFVSEEDCKLVGIL